MQELSDAKYRDIRSRIFSIVDDEINTAINTDTLSELLEKYGISLLANTTPQPITKRMIILIVGDLVGKKQDYIMSAKKFNIPECNLEFISFDEIKKFSVESLHYSNKYSDIVMGPIPHMINHLGGSNSLISMLQQVENKEEYPKLILASPNTSNENLKLTITAFREALKQTKLFMELNK